MSSVRDKRKIESSLRKKGFVSKDTHHRYFVYETISGAKTIIKTKFSHGADTDIGRELFSRVASQCKLNNQQLSDLVNCPMSRDDYEQLLANSGLLTKES